MDSHHTTLHVPFASGRTTHPPPQARSGDPAKLKRSRWVAPSLNNSRELPAVTSHPSKSPSRRYQVGMHPSNPYFFASEMMDSDRDNVDSLIQPISSKSQPCGAKSEQVLSPTGSDPHRDGSQAPDLPRDKLFVSRKNFLRYQTSLEQLHQRWVLGCHYHPTTSLPSNTFQSLGILTDCCPSGSNPTRVTKKNSYTVAVPNHLLICLIAPVSETFTSSPHRITPFRHPWCESHQRDAHPSNSSTYPPW